MWQAEYRASCLKYRASTSEEASKKEEVVVDAYLEDESGLSAEGGTETKQVVVEGHLDDEMRSEAEDATLVETTTTVAPDLVKVVPIKLKKRNADVTEWSVQAKIDIPLGTFIGFYTGEFSHTPRKSLYAAQVDEMLIYPFADENNITTGDRHAHPLANMNEPVRGSSANCCMLIQDFSADEVLGSALDARFYRGLACFTCEAVKAGAELTWFYGKTYQEHRQNEGYEAGTECKLLAQQIKFIPENSEGVLSVMSKIPLNCVFAVPIESKRKSNRFPLRKKRRKRAESSEDDVDSSSSGSGHLPKYDPSKILPRKNRRR